MLLKDEQFTPPSESDSLDPEIVREALENLGIDEDELQYKVSIMDYETGINHSLENVSCSSNFHMLFFHITIIKL